MSEALQTAQGRAVPSLRPLRDDPRVEPRADLTIVRTGGRRTEKIRRIELWSALKVSLILYLSVLAGILLIGAGLWTLGRKTGTLGSLESFVEEIYAAENYRFDGGKILRVSAVIGPILAVLASLGTVFGVALFNGVSRMTGGLRVTVDDTDEDEDFAY